MKSTAKCYPVLREYLETIPLIDCHDHSIYGGTKYIDPIQVIINGYFANDLISASSERDFNILLDFQIPLEKRWPILERCWKRTCHTGYAQVTRRVLKKFYGEEALTFDALKRMQSRLPDFDDRAAFDRVLDDARIAVRLEDILISDLPDHIARTRAVLNGSYTLAPRGRLVMSLPDYHNIKNYDAVQLLASVVNRTVTSLTEYLDVCREIFEGCKKFGAVAFKDQSAYRRNLEYGNPTRAGAEEVFNWLMADPRRSASYPDGVKPLDDFLFHEFMRMAKAMDLPVQIHTGHMAGVRNDIVKTNAVGLRSVIELHREVRFDLFHANWPYSGELLFMAKNYPNVTIDFCWANIIDPIYCQRMFQQALSSVPHGKIHGYGSDFCGCADRAWAHASIARDNIAIALSEMVEMDYLSLDDARQVAYDWLFGNANAFFRLDV
jgi:hypothetical protein